MKSIVMPAVALAVLLTAAGVVFWTMGKAEQRLADAHREMAMLQYADASAESDATVAARPLVQRMGGFGGDEQVDARHLHAAADYWQTRTGSRAQARRGRNDHRNGSRRPHARRERLVPDESGATAIATARFGSWTPS